MTNLYLYFLLGGMTFLAPLFGQPALPPSQLANLSAYRSELLQLDPEAPAQLGAVYDKWKALGASEADCKNLSNNVLISSQVYGSGYRRVTRLVRKHLTDTQLGRHLTPEDFEILQRNDQLLNLIHDGVLSAAYPFVIDRHSPLFAELSFYDIQDGESIGEVGAGKGGFSLLLNRLYPHTRVSVNDVDVFYLNYLRKILIGHPTLYDTDRLEPTKGSHSSTRLEGAALDKVIVRDAFHHFRKKDEMLASIRASLSAEGTLFLQEPVLPLGAMVCSLTLTRAAIVERVEAAGFELVGEMPLGERHLLKFILA